MIKHPRKKKNNTILLVIVIAVLLIGGLVYLSQRSNEAPKSTASAAEIDALAQCLSDKGVRMYGAEWCPHCKAQREAFGTSFSKIDYVECTVEQVKCNIAGIQGYPTWIYQGQKYEGEQTFEQLAAISGCEFQGSSAPISGGSSNAQ